MQDLMAFTKWLNDPFQGSNPWPTGHEVLTLQKGFKFYAFSFSQICMGVEKEF